MKGLQQRVTVGFMSIVGVLILAGAVSYIELSTLSDDADNILSANRRNRELANNMRGALQSQNIAFVQMTAFANKSYDSISINSINSLDKALEIARDESTTPHVLDSMLVTSAQLRQITNDYIEAVNDAMYRISLGQPQDSIKMLSGAEYYAEYMPIYDKMSASIDQYVTLAQNVLAPRTEQLHGNAYRAVTPVLISLTVMVVIVLMLYYFMLISCVHPIVAITRSLKDYIAYRIPFAPKGGGRDELSELSQMIEEVIEDRSNLKK